MCRNAVVCDMNDSCHVGGFYVHQNHCLTLCLCQSHHAKGNKSPPPTATHFQFCCNIGSGARVSRVTSFVGVAGVTGVSGVAGVALMAVVSIGAFSSFVGVAGVTGVSGVAGVALIAVVSIGVSRIVGCLV